MPSITVTLPNGKEVYLNEGAQVPNIGDRLSFEGFDRCIVTNVVRLYSEPVKNGLWFEKEILIDTDYRSFN